LIALQRVVGCALFDAFDCGKQCCTCVGIKGFLITLQEQIDTVTVEGVENVGEEDCIKVKTEEDYTQLVDRVKWEQEVSVLCLVLVCVCCTVHCV
jgi:hypothetical protein